MSYQKTPKGQDNWTWYEDTILLCAHKTMTIVEVMSFINRTKIATVQHCCLRGVTLKRMDA